jgi:carboxypeptidase D
VPAVAYVKEFNNLFRLNETVMGKLNNMDKYCGYTEYLNNWLVFPPKGIMPSIPAKKSYTCDTLWRQIKKVAEEVNACFNQYQITTTCPLLWDVLGFPGSFEYLPDGATVYFDRVDVKKAINAPVNQTWAECADIPLTTSDHSRPASHAVLPRVIEKSQRTVIAHGTLDFILLGNGTLLSIQNMTWNGAQGFTSQPKLPFVVPYHADRTLSTLSGFGTQGIYHTERNLTWVEVFLSGHMVPQYAPMAAFRMLEFLLGRIPDLSPTSPFTVSFTSRNVTSESQAFDGFDGFDGFEGESLERQTRPIE